MTREEKLAYARGYSAGRSNKWPAHLPPVPPNEVVAELMTAAWTVRNALDDFLATCGEDGDPGMEALLGPKIDAVDAAMAKVTLWLQMQDVA